MGENGGVGEAVFHAVALPVVTAVMIFIPAMLDAVVSPHPPSLSFKILIAFILLVLVVSETLIFREMFARLRANREGNDA